ncbi:hypothetical protein LUZ61_000788 [Rhynchospora tenuis]|uniref:Uncharacterized protein n=1 Tax=Rhynchospora tenuis TaxID=198213 RepID=A0AAD5ZFT4_9POAL|nr:hypothetical protein LUZ61_000788 [Rhynchospora tenuis]
MAESVVSYVMAKLGDAYVKEVLHLQGVSDEVEKVSRELSRIQAFLKDADRKRIIDERQNQLVKEVRDLAYRIEDVIDTLLTEVPEKKPGKIEAVKRWLTGIIKLPTIHRHANEIKKIDKLIQEIEASRLRYGITKLGEDDKGTQLVRRIMLPDVDEDGIVGFEADRDKIIDLLLDEKTIRRSVVSIVGPGGLGKTTLARKVYNRSRVLLTTRFLDVAEKSGPISIPYKLQFLNEESSIKLLLKKALPSHNADEYPHNFYNIGKQFAKKCGGLPLALVVLGGLLSKKDPNYVAWSSVIQTMNWGTDGEECTAIIGTSYDDLPFGLKSCFMYFAAFPEDADIKVRKLLRMWIAEGFIPQEQNRTLEDTAHSFLVDLVQRYGFLK